MGLASMDRTCLDLLVSLANHTSMLLSEGGITPQSRMRARVELSPSQVSCLDQLQQNKCRPELLAEERRVCSVSSVLNLGGQNQPYTTTHYLSDVKKL